MKVEALWRHATIEANEDLKTPSRCTAAKVNGVLEATDMAGRAFGGGGAYNEGLIFCCGGPTTANSET